MGSLGAWRRAIEMAEAEDLVVGVVGDSARVAANWSTRAALVFIDGGHGAGPCWADYRGWARHVAAGGFLVFHDVFPDPAEGGRPPYECYLDALGSGRFTEDSAASCRSCGCSSARRSRGMRARRRQPRGVKIAAATPPASTSAASTTAAAE